MAEILEKVKTSRELQAEKSKKKIYETAIQLFTEKGFENTKITEICRKASCSVGAFYHHYPSKESILDDTFFMADRNFEAWAGKEDSGDSGRELILEYMDSYTDLILDTGLDFTKIFFTHMNKTFVRKGRPMQTRLTGLIDRAVREERFSSSLPPEEICESIFICARGVVFHWCLHDGKFDLRNRMTFILNNLLLGMEK